MIEISRDIESKTQSEESYITTLMNSLLCRSNHDDEKEGLYIMTLGVIDECRKLGLGTQLLQRTFTTCS